MLDSTVQTFAEGISAQASVGPGLPGQPPVQNTLSPHFTRYVFESTRALLLKEVEKLEADIHEEMGNLREELATGEVSLINAFDNAVAKIKAHLHIFKTIQPPTTK